MVNILSDSFKPFDEGNTKLIKGMMDRRKFLKVGCQCAAGAVLLGSAGFLIKNANKGSCVQINPDACIACGGCQTNCVVKPSASKCINIFGECGYCDFCFGYFEDDFKDGKGTKVCPTDALKRRKVNDNKYEYTIDADRCIGCAKCVKRCAELGNASLHLEIQYSLCKECNQCGIAQKCPTSAVTRIAPYDAFEMPEEES